MKNLQESLEGLNQHYLELLKNLNDARKIAKFGSFVNDFSKEFYEEVDDLIYEILRSKNANTRRYLGTIRFSILEEKFLDLKSRTEVEATGSFQKFATDICMFREEFLATETWFPVVSCRG